MKVAVVGYGYWGPNLVRNFSWLEGVDVKYVCDLDRGRLDKVSNLFPNVSITTTEYQQILDDSEVEAVAIATPVNSHYSLSEAALQSGKHLLIEKPMTDTVESSNRLVELAKEKDRVLMVDHTFLYT
ncbi:MAG: Gfo/Idh/MocA family oxidoreductase, partial [Proteobacteria bacterium]|nr:Gfo/Idh/MocA family oxidoreductase [Pseudomonadota bacterium]